MIAEVMLGHWSPSTTFVTIPRFLLGDRLGGVPQVMVIMTWVILVATWKRALVPAHVAPLFSVALS